VIDEMAAAAATNVGVGERRPSRGLYGVDGQRGDGAQRSKPAPGPTHLPHKRLTGAYVAEIVSLNGLLRFVHSHGQGGAAVEWVAARLSALDHRRAASRVRGRG
jgi:hypothetical protein